MQKDLNLTRYEEAAAILPLRLRKLALALPEQQKEEAEEFRLRAGTAHDCAASKRRGVFGGRSGAGGAGNTLRPSYRVLSLCGRRDAEGGIPLGSGRVPHRTVRNGGDERGLQHKSEAIFLRGGPYCPRAAGNCGRAACAALSQRRNGEYPDSLSAGRREDDPAAGFSAGSVGGSFPPWPSEGRTH